MASHSFLVNHTEAFFEFYREHRIFRNIQPNAGHKALAELERRGILKAVITQHIDGLHQRAGSKTVHELHGSTLRWPCVECGKIHAVDYVLREENKPISHCEDCGGMVRPAQRFTTMRRVSGLIRIWMYTTYWRRLPSVSVWRNKQGGR